MQPLMLMRSLCVALTKVNVPVSPLDRATVGAAIVGLFSDKQTLFPTLLNVAATGAVF